MSLQRTEQLVKALALDFLHNQYGLFNIGVMEMLCEQQKVHSNTTQKQIMQKVSLIDKAFHLLKQQLIQKHQQQQSTKNTKKTLSNNLQISHNERNLHNMLSVFLFNISATNEHYIQQIEQHMVQSTAAMSHDKDMMSMTLQKDKMATNILKQHLRGYFELFTEHSKYLQEFIFQELKHRERKQFKQGEMSLLQTVDYLCVKYDINNGMSQKLIEILEQYEPSVSEEINVGEFYTSQQARMINKLVFGGDGESASEYQLFNILQTSSYINYHHLLVLINSNYLHKNRGNTNKRKIFSSAIKDGKQVVQALMIKVIKRVGKVELFNQQNQDYGPFKIILMHCLTKHFAVYWQFAQIINQLMSSQQAITTTTNSINLLKRIEQFFRISLTINHTFFQQFISFTYGVLQKKYNETIGIELMKKFLLNRFLLNPAFFILFHDPSEAEIQRFVSVANTVRTLFYPNKAQQLATQLNNPFIIKLSTDILQALQYCMRKQKDSKGLSALTNSNNFLYINDKIIKSTMLQLYQELQYQQEHHNYSKLITPRSRVGVGNNNNQDYSLEFSIERNQQSSKNIYSKPLIENVSEVRLASNTNRSNNPRDNQSIRYMCDQLRGERTSIINNIIPPPKSQQRKPQTKLYSDRQPHTQTNPSRFSQPSTTTKHHPHHQQSTRLYQQSNLLITDRQIIQQLVQLRKQYGQRKKQLTAQYQMRRTKSVRRISVLQKFSLKFNEFKNQIEKDNDTLYVHMTSIA